MNKIPHSNLTFLEVHMINISLKSYSDVLHRDYLLLEEDYSADILSNEDYIKAITALQEQLDIIDSLVSKLPDTTGTPINFVKH